jgi:hypothetical protein
MDRSSFFVIGGILLVTYACGEDANIASSSGDAAIGDPDASSAGSGGSASSSDGSASGSGNLSDAASDPDASTEEGDDAGDSGPGGVLIDGDGFGLVYSAHTNIGIDSRPDCSAEFDDAGNLIAYQASDMEQLALGDATLRSAGTSGTVAWGTWIGGPTTGVFYAAHPQGEFVFPPENSGFHYAVGKTATALPTGPVSYDLVGGSAPTLSNGSETGTLDSVAIVIDFGSGVDSGFGVTYPVGVEIEVTTEAGPAGYQTTGGIADLSATEGATFGMTFHANVGILGSLRGVIVDDGEALAISYVFSQGTVDSGFPPSVRGAAGLVRRP